MTRANVGNEPLPERQRFGMRIVDAENRNAFADPEFDDITQRQPQRRPRIVGVEVDVDDILVSLRRVLGVANAAVRRSEEHTSELQSLMRTSYAVFCLK